MNSLLTAVAALTVTTASSGGASHPGLLRVDLDTTALSALSPTCFRTPAAARPAPRAPASGQGLTWVLRADGEEGWSVLEVGAPSFVLGDAGRVALPPQLSGTEAHFSYQGFQARVEGAGLVERHTAAEVVLTPGPGGFTGTLTLSARDGCRGGTCQLACEVRLPFTATPVRFSLARG